MQRQMDDLELGQNTVNKKISTSEYNHSISHEEDLETPGGQQDNEEDWVQKREIHQLQVFLK